MTDRPILFSAPMVRALLDGRKTQTRRVIPQPEMTAFGWNVPWQVGGGCVLTDQSEPEIIAAELLNGIRYAVGDRLYVREAWTTGAHLDKVAPRDISPQQSIGYLADEHEAPWLGRRRPGMHMPKWASRLTLIVTDVRVQRLQEISSGDAAAEGVERESDSWRDYLMASTQCCANARASFRTLWDSLNASRGFGWDANPWVVAVSFTVERRNIDEVQA